MLYRESKLCRKQWVCRRLDTITVSDAKSKKTLNFYYIEDMRVNRIVHESLV